MHNYIILVETSQWKFIKKSNQHISFCGLDSII